MARSIVRSGFVTRYWVVPFFFVLLWGLASQEVLLSDNWFSWGDSTEITLPNLLTPPALWSNDIYSGYPVAGEPQTMSFYPVAMLLTKVSGSWNGFVLLGFFLVSFFTYLFLLRITASVGAACFGSLCFGFSSAVIAHIPHVNLIHSLAWALLVFWALESLNQSGLYRWVVVGALGVGLSIVSGFPQITAYFLGLSFFYAFLRWGQEGFRMRSFLQHALLFGLGGGLAAVQILPTLELVPFTSRAGWSYEQFVSFSLDWNHLSGLVVPWMTEYMERLTAHRPSEYSCYFGYAPLFLLGMGLSLLHRRDRFTGQFYFWLTAGILSWALALGDNTFLARIGFHIPVYNGFRVPARHLLLGVFSFSVFASLVLARLREFRPDRERDRRMARAVWAVALFCLVAAGAFYLYCNHNGQLWNTLTENDKALSLSVREVFYYPALFFILMGLLFFIRTRIPWTGWIACLIALSFLDLGFVGNRSWPRADQCIFPAEKFQAPSETLHYAGELDQTGQRLLPAEGVHNDFAYPNLNRAWGVPSAAGSSALIMRDYADLLRMGRPGDIQPSILEESSPVLDVFAVKYVIVNETSDSFRSVLDHSPRWSFKESVPILSRANRIHQYRIYENKRVFPRAWFVNEVVGGDRSEMLEVLRTAVHKGREFSLRNSAMVSVGDPAFFGNYAVGDVRDLRISNHRLSVHVRVEGEKAGYLVFSDIFYPGWRAYIDGKETTLIPTDALLRGMIVPAGEHEVRLAYEPRSVYKGAAISTLAFLLLLFLPIFNRRLRGDSRAPQTLA